MAFPSLPKNSLMFINIFFLVASLAIIALAIYIGIQKSELQDAMTLLKELPLTTFAYLIGIVGGFFFLSSLVAIIGITKESQKLLWIYCISLYLVCSFTFGLGIILIYIYLDSGAMLDEYVKPRWYSTHPDAIEERDVYQNFFECCGYYDPTDHPGSICDHTTGCREATIDFSNNNFLPLGICILILAVVELLGLFFGCILVCRPKPEVYLDSLS